MSKKLFSSALLIAAVLFAVSCKKESGDSDPVDPNTNPNNPNVPVIDGGRSYLSFDDSAKTTWYAESLEKSSEGNVVYMKGMGKDNTELTLRIEDLLGDPKVPVGSNVGYLSYTTKDGEVFDTRIGGGGNVFYTRNDKERVEGTFLFPLVQSISNEFMELNNGKFGFDLPQNVGLTVEEFMPIGESYVFIEKPKSILSGVVTYVSGPKTGYSVKVSSETSGLVDNNNVVFNGKAGNAFSYTINFGSLRKGGVFKVKAELSYEETVLKSQEIGMTILPIYGSYKLAGLNGAPANANIVHIEPIENGGNEFYKASSNFFGKTLTFEDDGNGSIECYDTFVYNGAIVTNIYFYDNGPNEIHMAMHSSSYSYFYQLIRQ